MWDWFIDFFEQDDFEDDPYGWLTNQAGHILLGVAMAYALSRSWYSFAGEYPPKQTGWLICAAVYIALEIVRGWNCWDSVEDTVFTSGYGSGGAFMFFSETTQGSTVLNFDADACAMLASFAFVHLVLGVAARHKSEGIQQ